MNKKFKKIISVILCAVLLFTTASTAFAAEEGRKVVGSGYCGAQGENLTWTLYDDGELVISGEGEMQHYVLSQKVYEANSPLYPPWFYCDTPVDVITIEEGVTGIGNEAFDIGGCGYYRVNLPKSLKYYYFSSFGVAAGYGGGRAVACCYAGSESDWRKVEQRGSITYSYPNTYDEITYFHYKHIAYGIMLMGNNGEIMYYNGEEPEIFCDMSFAYGTEYTKDIKNHGKSSVYVRYYPGEYEDATLVWRTEGDGCKLEYTGYIPSGAPAKADVVSVTHGEFSVIVDLVAADGTVLSTCRKDFFSYVPEDMTKEEKREENLEELKEKFAMVNFAAFFTSFFIVLPIILAPITEPLAFIVALFQGKFWD